MSKRRGGPRYVSGVNLFGYVWVIKCRNEAAAERTLQGEINALGWFLDKLGFIGPRWERSRRSLRITRRWPSRESVLAR